MSEFNRMDTIEDSPIGLDFLVFVPSKKETGNIKIAHRSAPGELVYLEASDEKLYWTIDEGEVEGWMTMPKQPKFNMIFTTDE